ncbi:MAG: hypothetical protein FI707_17920 [SAR202 cluster bacterium]|jgi:hypothetical protein|nr:hypothetical protein [Acidobacteriota bacterium]MDP6371774.1 hypothetical protein [Vicinamibacterales bacterium]MDP6801449.1 hypothetical protein [SAR202 cluster bacterium]MQG70643.1 hypothetical protein [SAR202 cluster bacterium]HAK55987.1 hypothetical protein [Acidobacteriota bacterium]|tara:strand:- start:10488 stop:10811 length:324 start_codon:yes stop_codon:yes gene_type:complete
MAHTYEELHKMTVAQLREVAVAQDSDDLDGFKSMHKAPLLAQLCKVLGIDPHEHHTATGLDKAAVKAQMRELRGARLAALEAHDHTELRIVRRKIHRLNRKIRRATT